MIQSHNSDDRDFIVVFSKWQSLAMRTYPFFGQFDRIISWSHQVDLCNRIVILNTLWVVYKMTTRKVHKLKITLQQLRPHLLLFFVWNTFLFMNSILFLRFSSSHCDPYYHLFRLFFFRNPSWIENLSASNLAPLQVGRSRPWRAYNRFYRPAANSYVGSIYFVYQ